MIGSMTVHITNILTIGSTPLGASNISVRERFIR